ncbi:MAG: hypothetical protein M1812_003500 [Candelaria pacifica]|nr:MAG: hypothetical protein M1812_003500 [Candelaria pacifica]
MPNKTKNPSPPPTKSTSPPPNLQNPAPPSSSPTSTTTTTTTTTTHTNPNPPTTSTPPPLRLTDTQKKSNHILSEQKRRQAIRTGFDRLTELVPDCEGEARSESVVLRKTVVYCRLLADERRRLVREIEVRGGVVERGVREMVFWEGWIDGEGLGEGRGERGEV